MAVGNIELLIDASQLPAKTKTSALFKGIKQNVESSQHNSHIKDIIQNNLTYQKKKKIKNVIHFQKPVNKSQPGNSEVRINKQSL